jgi:hypothetical protein
MPLNLRAHAEQRDLIDPTPNMTRFIMSSPMMHVDIGVYALNMEFGRCLYPEGACGDH